MTTARFVVAAARQVPPPAPAPRPAAVQAVPPPAPVSSPPADLRAVPVLRIAMWQVALVVGAAGIGRGLAAGVAAGVVAVLVLTLGAVRVRGEWLSTVARRWLGLVARRRTWGSDWTPLPKGWATTSDGVLVGADGMTVVARTPVVELPELDTDGPELDLQLVAHLGPRQAKPGAWLAITARRDADHAGDDELRVPLENALRRLRKSGRDLKLLPAAELRPTLAGIAHAGPAREQWRCWRSGPVTQITLRLRGGRPALVDRLLAEGRDAAVTVAVRRDGTGVLRVAATSDAAAEQAVARLIKLGAHLGVRLTRLDGSHGPAVLASLPIGRNL